jgi:hypothetical protein
MATKATIERLTQLQRAATGKETKRPVGDILKSEKAAAAQYLPAEQPVTPPAQAGESEATA